MTATPKYLQEDIDGCIHHTPKYMEMDRFCHILVDLARNSEDYIDEGLGFYSDDVWIDTDAWVHEECEDIKEQAILKYHDVTKEELEAWCEENPEVSHWVVQMGQFAGCEQDDDFVNFIDNYEPEGRY